MGNSSSQNWDGNNPQNYPSNKCFEGYGGSHCSHRDIARGTNAMNNLDEEYGPLSQAVSGRNAPYNAAAGNIKGPCPNPSAHKEKNHNNHKK